jgi:MoaA/NifB/PqqE/SkfB family radical SAM enzyme
MNLTILYRGPLSSCNYACDYCPFAKRTETAEQLAHDRECLERFVNWIAAKRETNFSILFTPWGESLVRKWYQQSLVQLSQMSHIKKVAIQTNLSCKLDWVEESNRKSLALWCTYHPSETTREKFLMKCRELIARCVRFSVGVVGLKEHVAEIDALRNELPRDVYLWVNAYKREPDYYSPEIVDQLTRLDPHFPMNNRYHTSLGQSCRTGHSVVSVDGDGTVRRCHFVREQMGNLYDSSFERALVERPCPNETCGCHIGYVHLDSVRANDVFGDRILERIPLGFR